jgi:hypothetical protein
MSKRTVHLHHPEQATAEWPAGVPEMLRYEDILLLIGRHLDDADAEGVTIIEVETGFLVRARGAARASDLFEFQLADLALAVSELQEAGGETARERDEVPGGYAEFLRALGNRLDLREATYVTITEGANFLAVTGVEPTPSHDSARSFEEILLPDEVAHLIHSYAPTNGLRADVAHPGTDWGAGGAQDSDTPGGVRRLFRRLRTSR